MNSRASSNSEMGGRIVRLGGGQTEITIPRIFMPQDVFQRIAAYVDLYPKEIAGIGCVQQVAPLQFLVESAFLVRQDTNQPAHVDISDGFVEFAEAKAVADESTRNHRFWWHSHVNFPAKWSDEDRHTAKKMFDDGWLVAMVMNRRREFCLRFEYFSPVHFVFDNLPLELILRDSPHIRGLVKADIRANVVEPPSRDNKRSGLMQRVQEALFGGREDGRVIKSDVGDAEVKTPGPDTAAPPKGGATAAGDTSEPLWPEGWAPPTSGAPATKETPQSPTATTATPQEPEQETGAHG
ncbi:MAG: hypothetical protein V1723_01450 [Candidatus Uhrbacteria bacterium]